jgi:hypothetical protein
MGVNNTDFVPVKIRDIVLVSCLHGETAFPRSAKFFHKYH